MEDTSAEPQSDLAVLAPEASQDQPFTAEAFQATSLRGSSINRGTAEESVTTVVRGDDPGKTLTIGVAGFNQAFSPQPYLVHLTYQPAPGLPPCIADRDLSTDPVGALPSFPVADNTQTVILAAPSRMPGLDMVQLQTFAARGDVRGVVLPVDGDEDVRIAYENWDANPCSVEAANRVAGAITEVIGDAIDDSNGELRHLVTVGNDDVIPQGRLIYPVGMSNEADHAFEVVYGSRTNPISAALGAGYMLADPYASLAPFDFLEGDLLYLPNVAAGRLVETPADVAAAIDAFVAADGQLEPDRAFTAGYGFLADGASAIHDRLSAGVGPGNAELRTDQWTGQDAVAGIDGAAGGFASVNAHYDQTQLLPTSGTQDIVNASDPSSFVLARLAVLLTVGCHAGLNIPNRLSTDQVATGDWAQRLLERGAASYLANTGYGCGDDETVAVSESSWRWPPRTWRPGT